MVIPRAMVRDLADGHAAAILMSRLMLVMGAAPILAPSIGGLVLLFAHWRVIFVILAIYGAIGCVLVWRFLPETLPPAAPHQPASGRPDHAAMAPSCASAASSPTPRWAASASFAMFAYLGGSSPVFIQGFNLAPSEYALIFGLNSCGLVAASQINARMLPRFGLPFMLRLIARVLLVAAAVLSVAGVRRRARTGADRWRPSSSRSVARDLATATPRRCACSATRRTRAARPR